MHTFTAHHSFGGRRYVHRQREHIHDFSLRFPQKVLTGRYYTWHANTWDVGLYQQLETPKNYSPILSKWILTRAQNNT